MDGLAALPGSNMDPRIALAFKQRYDDANAAVAEAVAERKNLRAEIKGAGIPLAAWDRYMRDDEKSSTKRNHEEVWYQQLMAWAGKPVPHGGQADFDFGGEDAQALNEHRIQQAKNRGFSTGRAGGDESANPWDPGTEGYMNWANGFRDGKAELDRMGGGSKRVATAPSAGSATGDQPKKRQGRPKGSKNKPKTPPGVVEKPADQQAAPEPAPGRGEPEDREVDADIAEVEHVLENNGLPAGEKLH
jgi:hypothetical protein